MRLAPLLLILFRSLLPPTLIGLTWIYTYPLIYGCSFPLAVPSEASCRIPGSEKPGRAAESAPFRLLCLADPQLEGGSSVPALEWRDGLLGGLGKGLKRWQKQLDLWGNDRFLAHLYASMKWWTGPTHTVVLGDLLGSQWIDDGEFEKRKERFWRTVFKGGEMVANNVTGRWLGSPGDDDWTKRIIAVVGNHDVGYAGDLNERKLRRFEEGFGKANWEIRLSLPQRKGNESSLATDLKISPGASPLFGPSTTPELRLVILNSMNLDSPAYDASLQQDSRDFLNSALPASSLQKSSGKTGTILLTHIPLHKTSAHCVDGHFMDYFSESEGSGIREQNWLSLDTSQKILDGLATAGGSALILDGHDHEGCDTWHYKSLSDWITEPFSKPRLSLTSLETNDQYSPLDWERKDGIREVTVRSMMGEFFGNAGLLSAWYDEDESEWKFAYDTCAFGVQHIWWSAYILALVELGLGIAGLARWEIEGRRAQAAGRLKKVQ